MKGLPLQDLIKGQIYTCLLSGKSVLITHKIKKDETIQGEFISYWSVTGHYYNTDAKRYDTMYPYDFQLYESPQITTLNP